MKATSKKQINLNNLKKNDEIVTYSSNSSHTSCIKMRTIGNKRKFIIDDYDDLNGFISTTYSTLTEAKSNISHCYHF